MRDKPEHAAPSEHHGILRIGMSSYLNARPFTAALPCQQNDISITYDAPSRLTAKLQAGHVDVALIPSIDYYKLNGNWPIFPDLAITSDGPVLTSRIFSHRPLPQIDVLACDPEAHTAVALAQVIWHMRFHQRLAVVPYDPHTPIDRYQAVLLVGDKTIQHNQPWPYQLDLGAAWTELTLLPFVYAFWVGHPQADHDYIYNLMTEAFQKARPKLKQIAHRYAATHGFTPELAEDYLLNHIQYEFALRQQRGLTRFYELAQQYHIIPQYQALHFYQSKNQ